MRGDPGRQPHLGGPLPSGNHRPLQPALGKENVLGDGEHGELVFTSLTKEALPIIRYRTKDLTRLLPGTARPAHRRMGRITGRSDDMIILRGVNLFPSQIEEIALRIPELSPHFQLELTRPEGQRMDQLTVKIERRDNVTTGAKHDGGPHPAGADQDPCGFFVHGGRSGSRFA